MDMKLVKELEELIYSIRHSVGVGLVLDLNELDDEFLRGRAFALEQLGHRLTDIVKEAYKRAYLEAVGEVHEDE